MWRELFPNEVPADHVFQLAANFAQTLVKLLCNPVMAFSFLFFFLFIYLFSILFIYLFIYSFIYLFIYLFKTGFLCVVLAVLELML